MKLEEVYKILKESNLSDFYIPHDVGEIVFIYKENIGLSISKIEDDTKDFGSEFFYNTDGTEKDDLTKYEELIMDLCRLKFPKVSTNKIYGQQWALKYNGQIIYTLSCLCVKNPSSLYAIFPIRLDVFDFQFNFCEICNDYYGANSTYRAKEIIESKVNVQESTYQNFLDS